ncbi:hypothetical protein ACH4A8_29490 [Streptomyces vietnamensis]|uniref:hypothetical protein n=1 Tax=Streptomyces vietnamensis TaxID=362257 RepID=UPI0037985A8C
MPVITWKKTTGDSATAIAAAAMFGTTPIRRGQPTVDERVVRGSRAEHDVHVPCVAQRLDLVVGGGELGIRLDVPPEAALSRLFE